MAGAIKSPDPALRQADQSLLKVSVWLLMVELLFSIRSGGIET